MQYNIKITYNSTLITIALSGGTVAVGAPHTMDVAAGKADVYSSHTVWHNRGRCRHGRRQGPTHTMIVSASTAAFGAPHMMDVSVDKVTVSAPHTIGL